LGSVTGALVVIADGFHSLVDSSSNLIGLTAIKLASRPPDERHPYGYQRYETLGALGIGGLLIAAAWEIIQSVFDRLINGADMEISWLAFGLMALTFPINLGIVLFETRSGKRLNSSILLADATHTKTDLFVTGSVIASLVGIRLGWAWLDPLVAVGVVVLILRASVGILRDSAGSLADVACIQPSKLERIAYSVPGVRYVHNIRSRGASDAIFVDLHIEVDPSMSTAQAHALASEVERRLKKEMGNIADALVHIEPARQEESSDWEQVAYGMRQIADGMGLGFHDLHVHVDHNGDYVLEMDIEIGGDINLEGAHRIADHFEERVVQHWPNARQVITHLEPLVDILQYPLEQSDGDFRKKVYDFLSSRLDTDSNPDVQVLEVGGQNRLVIKLTMPPETTLITSHERVEILKRELWEQFPQVSGISIHVEPV
jgi:cation diffusion facilitator family transporter